MSHSNLSNVASEIILSKLPNNDKHRKYEDEYSGCLADSIMNRTTTYVYKGTGSKVVSPTMIPIDEWDDDGYDKAFAEAEIVHKEDMKKVLSETIKYRDLIAKELEWCDKEIEKLEKE